MKSSLVYDTIISLLRKDVRGNSLKLTEFNHLAPVVSTKVYQKYFQSEDRDLYLAAFIQNQTPITCTAGGNSAMPYAKGIAPQDMYWMVGKPFYSDNGIARFLDQVTPLQLAGMYSDYLKRPSASEPVYQLIESPTAPYAFLCYPSNIRTIYLDYYRLASVPFLDFYVNNSTLETTYLDEGASLAIPAGCVYRDGTTGIKQSLTVDFEWGQEDLPLILAFFLQETGVTLPDNLLIEAGIKNEQDILQ